MTLAIMTAVIDTRPVLEWLAHAAALVALWAQTRANHEPDPVDELTERLRHPVRWTCRHPVVSVRRKLERRRPE